MTEKSQNVYDLVNEMNWVQLYREMNFFHDSITDSIWMVNYNFFFENDESNNSSTTLTYTGIVLSLQPS